MLNVNLINVLRDENVTVLLPWDVESKALALSFFAGLIPSLIEEIGIDCKWQVLLQAPGGK